MNSTIFLTIKTFFFQSIFIKEKKTKNNKNFFKKQPNLISIKKNKGLNY